MEPSLTNAASGNSYKSGLWAIVFGMPLVLDLGIPGIVNLVLFALVMLALSMTYRIAERAERRALLLSAMSAGFFVTAPNFKEMYPLTAPLVVLLVSLTFYYIFLFIREILRSDK
ncbi:hypothetical protein BI364_15190 [Acidihalobacter yilgarnensis]|uniref:Uncharacterized protein n=1 Tax=Acidihalobacter yilgarnensis TaxID=2819280 RepID=A0A1D8IRY3_9GAMM|nr:hypothetical protein [Acidihalobacter yilgarnensis]AOU99104.1 hypothetical protein BI364_15190 [Acidihalobacter yilgarnensis]